MELYARFVLLLTLVLEKQSRMGLQEKTELFLELFGNLQIRKQSLEYVEKMATDFIRMVTDFDFLEKKLPILDLLNLKFKERDMLEAIFKFWRNTDAGIVQVTKSWDSRLRKYLGVRYDAIPNIFDWDYNMKLVEKGASIIYNKHYSRWRHHGNAFEIREGSYDCPNKTLVSGVIIKHGGEKIASRGYWGDILVSPYIPFGIECEEQSYFKKNNMHHAHTAEEVSEFNIMSMMYEVIHRNKYVKPNTDEQTKQTTATLTEISEEDEEQEEGGGGGGEETSTDEANDNDDHESIEVDNIKIYFLPLNCAHELKNKSKYQQRFNMVYISNSMVHLLTEDLTATFAEEASLVLETAKFMLELRDEQCREFIKRVTQMATNVGCQMAGSCDVDKDCFLNFIYNKKKEAS